MKPKAYSYIRFSSVEQAKGHSQKRQLERAREYAEAHSLVLVTEQEYAFFDAGKSAYKAKHLSHDGELRRFLSLVEDGSIKKGSYLLIENLDRLSREKVGVALPRFIDLLQSGIKVVTLTDERIYDENFNEMDLIISIVQLSRAHEESASKGYRVSKAWQNKQAEARNQKKPLGKACPAWLTVENSEFKVIESRANTVELIFDLTLKGLGRVKIAKYLNENGIPPFGAGEDGGPQSRRNKSGAWGTSSIAKILGNRAVIGEYQPYQSAQSGRVQVGEPVHDYYPKIISNDLFNRAQKEIRDRKINSSTRQSHDFNFWQKVSFCANCMSPMHLVNKGKPPKGYRYLVCANARKGACSGKLFRHDHLEMFIPRALFLMDSLPLVRANSAKISNDIETLEGEKIELAEKIHKYSELLRSYPSNSTAKILAECEQKIAHIEEIISELADSLTQEYVTDWDSFLESIDLRTYEGRLQANSLVRRLGITFTFSSQRGDPELDHPIDIILHVARKEFSGNHEEGFTLIAQKSGDIPEYNILSDEYTQRSEHYSGFKPALETLVERLEAMGKILIEKDKD